MFPELQRGLSSWDVGSKGYSGTEEGVRVDRGFGQKSGYYVSAVKRSGAEE